MTSTVEPQYFSFVLRPGENPPQLKNLPKTCRDRIRPEFILTALGATSLPRYLGTAVFDNQIVGFVLGIGPLSSEEIENFRKQYIQAFRNGDEDQYQFAFYDLLYKYELFREQMNPGDRLFWREATCVVPEFSMKQRPDLRVAEKLRAGFENHICLTPGRVFLGVDTSFNELVPYLEKEGFQIWIAKTQFFKTNFLQKQIQCV